MEVVFNDDSMEYSEFVSVLKGQGFFSKDTLYIDKYLKEDKTISLELLEIAIQEIVKENRTIKISGIDKYFYHREVQESQEEITFISRFVESVANELNDSDEEVVVLWASEIP